MKDRRLTLETSCAPDKVGDDFCPRDRRALAFSYHALSFMFPALKHRKRAHGLDLHNMYVQSRCVNSIDGTSPYVASPFSMCSHLSRMHILSVIQRRVDCNTRSTLRHAGHHPLTRPPRARNMEASKIATAGEELPDLLYALKKGGVRLDDFQV